MRKNKLKVKLYLSLIVLTLFSCTEKREPIAQESIPRVDLMPNLPQPLKILDWDKKAKEFDAYVFNFNTVIKGNPIIWLDSSNRNIKQTTFGIYTAINDVRQGAKVNNGEFHESLNSMTAVLSGGLMGIDKTNQNGLNYVKMLQNYFNSDDGWNIMMNNTSSKYALLGGGHGRDWWYDVLPNALFYAICDLYPNVEGAEALQRQIANQFVKADSILNGNYNYSFFDYSKMCGVVSHIPLQQDAAGGHAYVLYLAYKKFGDKKYLEHAKKALDVLNSQTESTFYEILLPLGIYTAARINAEEGTSYDVAKMLNWVFDGVTNPKGRYGWGIIAERWGDYDVYGLQGSITDNGGFAFLMNSIKMSWPLVPMVKYAPSYAKSIGKWMLNNVNASRLSFPLEIDTLHQWLPKMKDITGGVISYEGLRKEDNLGNTSLKGVSPVALGDGPLWNDKNPPESMFSVYSTAPIGIYGAMIKKTNIEGILQINCNTTDFYGKRDYPTYLYYNPYKEDKEVVIKGNKFYDIISQSFLTVKNGKIDIPSNGVRLIEVR